MHRFNACYLAKLSFKVPRCTLRPFDNTLLVIDVFLCSVSYKGSLRFLNHLTGRSPSHPDPPPLPPTGDADWWDSGFWWQYPPAGFSPNPVYFNPTYKISNKGSIMWRRCPNKHKKDVTKRINLYNLLLGRDIRIIWNDMNPGYIILPYYVLKKILVMRNFFTFLTNWLKFFTDSKVCASHKFKHYF